MKDLSNNPELKRYKVQLPSEVVNFVRATSIGTNVYSFEIPLIDISTWRFTDENKAKVNEDPILKVLVMSDCIGERENLKTRITASVGSKGSTMIQITPSEVEFLNEILQNTEESLVWQFNPTREHLRSVVFKAATGNSFDMTGFVFHLYEYMGDLPPFFYAYTKKVQKNKGLMYSRGTIDGWKFVHIQTKELFPWFIFQQIAKKEFGNSAVYVFFNAETKKHPCEYVIWCRENSTKKY